MNIKIRMLYSDSIKPEYKSCGASCLDCYSHEDITIRSGATVGVSLGFALQLPKDCEAQIRPRSGLSIKGIDTKLGTIDSDYRGEVKAIMQNTTQKPFIIKKGDRVCQMFIGKTWKVRFNEKPVLNNTLRGDKGFGSTGIK